MNLLRNCLRINGLTLTFNLYPSWESFNWTGKVLQTFQALWEYEVVASQFDSGFTLLAVPV